MRCGWGALLSRRAAAHSREATADRAVKRALSLISGSNRNEFDLGVRMDKAVDLLEAHIVYVETSELDVALSRVVIEECGFVQRPATLDANVVRAVVSDEIPSDHWDVV